MIGWVRDSVLIALLAVSMGGLPAQAQFDIFEFEDTEEGPWSDIDNTTLMVPRVADGGVTIDGSPSSAEYGAFQGVTVTPGDNAWILAFPEDRQWDNPDDSSFTFWLAHDTDYLYVGVEAKDDVVLSDDENIAFWKDDAIEIVVDALNDRVNNNTDNSTDPYGGHNYVNYEGRFSRWDDELEEPILGTWANEVDYTYGPDGDIFGVGSAVEGGWNMEVRFHKRQFEDPDAGNKLVEGYKMGFNIGMDDDDGFGIGPEGSGERGNDLEIQYWWANRLRPLDFTPEALEDGETIADFLPMDDWEINGDGRLSHGGTGEIIFGPMAGPSGDFNANGSLDAGDLDVLAQYVVDGNLAGDLDGDGDTDSDDRIAWIHDVQGSWLGDSNFDGEFSSADFVAVFTSGKYETGEMAGYAEGDWDGDMEFTSGDFVAAFTDGGYEMGPRPATAAVPEPSTAVLLIMPVWLVLCGLRRARV